MAKKILKAKKREMMNWGMCCLSGCGIIHFLGGLGVGFLLVSYFSLGNVVMWGWVLVVVAAVGHFWKKTRCEYCGGM